MAPIFFTWHKIIVVTKLLFFTTRFLLLVGAFLLLVQTNIQSKAIALLTSRRPKYL